MLKEKANNQKCAYIQHVTLLTYDGKIVFFKYGTVTKKLVNIKIRWNNQLYTWEDDVINYIKDMKIRNWGVYIQDRK